MGRKSRMKRSGSVFPAATTPNAITPRGFFVGFIAGAMIMFVFMLFVNLGSLGGEIPTHQDASTDQELQALLSKASSLTGQLEASEADAALWTALGNTYYDIGSHYKFASGLADVANPYFEKAIEAYNRSLEIQPGIVPVIVDRATAAYYMGDNDMALTGFADAIALEPDFINARLNYGVFLANALEDYEGAIEHWEHVLTLNPSIDLRQKVERLIAQAREHLTTP